MTRIIAGAARGRTLATPKQGTRPTSDRVRESLFSSLESMDALADARVLDLFAGTGALGLEALSRGAASATFVERASSAARILKQNCQIVRDAIAATGADSPAATVVTAAAHAFLKSDAATYDLVFIDPPYDLGADELARVLAELAPRIHPDAVVVLERSSRDPLPDLPAELELLRTKTIGETALHYFARAESNE